MFWSSLIQQVGTLFNSKAAITLAEYSSLHTSDSTLNNLEDIVNKRKYYAYSKLSLFWHK